MPSGWNVYYVVFLSAVLALGIPAVLGLISLMFSPEKKIKNEGWPGEVEPLSLASDTSLGNKINTRFFLGTNAALMLIMLALILVPLAGTFRAGVSHDSLLYGLIAILSVALMSVLGLLYATRKGDLDWLKSYQHEDGNSK